MGYIYKITNKINGKVYIGKTMGTVQDRFKQHCQEAKTHNPNRPFHYALLKYGYENFKVEVLEELENSEELNQREQFWIEKENSYVGFEDSNGYNATLGGEGQPKRDYKMIADKYLELQSQIATAKFFNCSDRTVRKACNLYNIQSFNNLSGIQIKRISLINPKDIKIYKSIRQAAIDLAPLINEANIEALRKKLTRKLNQNNSIEFANYLWQKI